MTVRVLFFAAAREVIGHDELEIQIPDNATVADLESQLSQAFPDLVPLLTGSSWSVNHQIVAADNPLPPDAEVGLILPVSGG